VSLDLRSGDALIDLVREGFGAPLSQKDQALCTCCAVFSVHEPVPLTHSPVGLASGLMLLSTSGEGAAGTYPAFGSYDPSRLGTASAGAACNDALRQEHALAR
jgi:hypothetical protein